MSSASTKRGHKRNAAYVADGLPWNDKAEKEIQRLRAAMVQAMDDAEWGEKTAGPPSRERFRGIARRLKAALEKK